MKEKDIYYDSLKEEILKTESFEKVANYTKEQYKVKEYYKTGEILSKAGKEYGKNIIGTYSEKLMKDVNNKYNYRTLYRIRKFYDVFSNKKLTAVLSILTWTHYIELLSIKKLDEILYYVYICKKYNLSTRELHERIKNNEYERLPKKAKEKLIKSEKLEV